MMFLPKKYSCGLVAVLICCTGLLAQQTIPGDTLTQTPLPGNEQPVASSFIIRNIEISGNKKTKPFIIHRELPFKSGEAFTLQQLVQQFEVARRQLMNTALFLEVVVALKNSEGVYADILVDVKERWYLFPAIYFRPVDRNLNQWIVEQKASLQRVNYGAKILYFNTSGRNDKLEAGVSGGYTRQLSFSYERPYFDKKLKWGWNAGFSTGKNREVNYNTVDNKQIFFKDESRFIRNFIYARGEITYRKAINTKHKIGIAYTQEEVRDTLLALNPDYFKSGSNHVRFPELYYAITYYNMDYIPYPTKGYAVEAIVGKKGINKTFNLWQLSVKGLGSWHVMPKTFVSLRVLGHIKLPFKQPFFNQRMIGYGDMFLQGYEYYVADGVAGAVIKTSITREVINFKIRMPHKKEKTGLQVPFRIFAKIYGNTGYAHNPQPGENFLTNKMLYSGGLGIDVVTLYDLTFKLEWSFNQLGQNGLFLHHKSLF
jgi:outer membrane protein assembly factor BamA